MRGFTLLEVLLACAITVFALLTMIGVFVSGLRLMAQGRDVAAATGVAREAMEAIGDLGYGALPAGTVIRDGRVPDPPEAGFPPPPYPRAVVNNREFFVTVKVEPRGPVLKSVTTEVTWEGRKVTLQTYCKP